MFRRVLFFSVVAVTLTALPALAQATGRAGSAAAAASGQKTTSYVVYHRKPGSVEWNTYRTYPTAREAIAASRDLHQKGMETEIQARVAMKRVPARQPSGQMANNLVVTPKQAWAAYRMMLAQKDIAFKFPADGCYARAHLMVRRMQAKGYKPYKVWSFANGDSLQVRTENDPRKQVTWRYHVAPILRVRLKDGKQGWYVIDPSLFKGPVSIKGWSKAQKKPNSQYEPIVRVTPPGKAPIDASGKQLPGSGYWPGPDPKVGVDAHAQATMRRHKPFEGKLPPRSVAGAPTRTNRVAVLTEGR
jgi:hypothetical protein